ncbi:hypothetical protein [Thermomonospora umbrina]|uniref:hypothetical protein n=1 Tax=Thermomonospora umbrina TaxID=111806 RepID=UPI000E2762CB|nr:hypothetical protein [Thermomonospora umbrina]
MTERVSGGRRGDGLRLNEEAVAARSAVLSVLACWSAMVADERRVTRPARREATELAGFLAVHLDWLLAHQAAADFAEEILRAAAKARRAAHSAVLPEMDLGPCPHTGCTGVMSAMGYSRGNGRGHDVRCDAGHVWLPHQWLKLSRQIEGTRRRGGAEARHKGGAP